MKKYPYRLVTGCFLIALIVGLVWSHLEKSKFIPWVWEYPADLTYLARGATVSYFAGIISLTDKGEVAFTPRRQPMKINDDIKTIPVVRIDRIEESEKLTDTVRDEITEKIIQTCENDKKAIGCQIDFDALESQYDAYLGLIHAVNMKLKNELPLSITALVSWCYPGGWLDRLPPDVVAIPMFFRMGSDAENIRAGRVPKDFLEAKSCQESVGISTDEPLPSRQYLDGKKEVYIFSPDSLTKSQYTAVKRLLGGL